MKLDNGQFLCVFCLSSTECLGPHIEEKHADSFYEFLYYSREDHADTAVEEIEKYEREKGLDLTELKEVVKHKIMDRQR